MKKIRNIFCVIGDPIGHSISPEIHKYVFESLGIDYQYEAVHVLPANLESFIQESRNQNRPGFNVTIPHKETIMPFLDHIDEAAKNIGAVNTIMNHDGMLTGYNTDVHGCRFALQKGGFNKGGTTMLLGAGGAARAALEAMASLNVKKVYLYDVIPEKSEQLKNHFQRLHNMDIITATPTSENITLHLEEINLLINASPVGMWPKTGVTPLPYPEHIPPGTTVLDMVYKPLHTRLLRETGVYGAKTVSGLHMLIAQALAADEIWLDRKLPEVLYDRVYHHILNIMENNG